MKYRLGRKQKRAILDEKGLEIALFTKGYENLAEITCEILNQIIMTNKVEYQRQLVEQLRSNPSEYRQASIYTVILDLVDESGIDEVFMILHNVASDIGDREHFESMFDKAKTWIWE